MAIFPAIEVQGNEDEAVDNRKIWFGEKMEDIIDDINGQRTTAVRWGSLKTEILNSANLKNLFKNDYNRNQPLNIIGTELTGLPYQLEVTLSGSSYSRLARYAGRYTLTNEKKNNRHVWVKQAGGHAIWSILNEGWRIGSISEKDRNFDNTAFKSNGFGYNPIAGGHWEYRFPYNTNVYKPASRIIRSLNDVTDKNARDLQFNDRRFLQQHVTDFRKAFQGLIDGTDTVETCIQTYNNYGSRHYNYNCGDPIRQPGTPCGGDGRTNIIPINNLAWLGQQLQNRAQPVLKSWIFENTRAVGNPNIRTRVQLSTHASIGGNVGGSLNMKDRLTTGNDLKAHFYFSGIRA